MRPISSSMATVLERMLMSGHRVGDKLDTCESSAAAAER